MMVNGPPERRTEHAKQSSLVTGQIIEVNADSVLMYLCGIDDATEEAWVSTPMDLPHWALDGSVWTADISKDIETFTELSQRRWALRNFQPTPRPELTIQDLSERLISRMIEEIAHER